MERHFGYLSTSRLIAEAGRDANEARFAIGHGKIVRRICLVLSSDRQVEDSPQAHVEESVIGITLFPNASLQCGNAGVQNLMFYGKGKYLQGISRKISTSRP